MNGASSPLARAAGYLYPRSRSSRAQVIVALSWSGLIGIVMVVGLFIDHGWIGRIGSAVVLVGLVFPQWARSLPLLRSHRNPPH